MASDLNVLIRNIVGIDEQEINQRIEEFQHQYTTLAYIFLLFNFDKPTMEAYKYEFLMPSEVGVIDEVIKKIDIAML